MNIFKQMARDMNAVYNGKLNVFPQWVQVQRRRVHELPGRLAQADTIRRRPPHQSFVGCPHRK